MDAAGHEELLRRARRRDPDALAELCQHYSARIYGLLVRLTGCRETAADLLQETFLRVVRTIDQYEHSGRFESWLFRIAANLARDRARQGRRRGVAAALDDEEERSAPAGGVRGEDGPGELAQRREAGERLAAALERLSEMDREILVLRHYSELPFREIAELLGVPLGTALARAHRALARLRKELEPPADA